MQGMMGMPLCKAGGKTVWVGAGKISLDAATEDICESVAEWKGIQLIESVSLNMRFMHSYF